MRILLLLIAICGTLVSFSQSGRQLTPLYDLSNTRLLNKGWHFAPGVTYMMPRPGTLEDVRLTAADGVTDTLYAGTYDVKGKPGIYLEVGRHHLLDYYFLLDNIDYGLGFKMFRGTEDFTGIVKYDTVRFEGQNQASFNESFLSAFVNFGNIHQLTDRLFLHNSLGLNADYRILKSREASGDFTGMIHAFPSNFVGQAHVKFGVGFKLESRVFVIPSIETPILTIAKFDDGKSTIQYFSSRYRPFIFSLRFVLLDKRKSADCVGKGDGQSGHQLWGKKMYKKYNRR
jgi:hypothetical protein